MPGLFISVIYGLWLWLVSGYVWQESFIRCSDFLFRWYFMWSLVLCILVTILWACAYGIAGLFTKAYKTVEFALLWLQITVGVPYSLLRFGLKRVTYVFGAYFLNQSIIFDAEKLPVYSFQKESLFYGLVLLMIGLLFLSKKPIIKLKPRRGLPDESVLTPRR